MADAGDAKVTQKQAGLCTDCAYAQVVESDRGSIFLLCELSKSDPRFVKYPRLPMLSCSGYLRKTERR
jgi:hypothetical protein